MRGSAKGSYSKPKYQRDSMRNLGREVRAEVEETVLALDLERVLDAWDAALDDRYDDYERDFD